LLNSVEVCFQRPNETENPIPSLSSEILILAISSPRICSGVDIPSFMDWSAQSYVDQRSRFTTLIFRRLASAGSSKCDSYTECEQCGLRRIPNVSVRMVGRGNSRLAFSRMNQEPNIPAFLCFVSAFMFAYGAYIADILERRKDDDRDE
jgi:hypothetical protein